MNNSRLHQKKLKLIDADIMHLNKIISSLKDRGCDLYDQVPCVCCGKVKISLFECYSISVSLSRQRAEILDIINSDEEINYV